MKKKDPVWIDERDVMAIHDRLLALHGGAAGLRDQGLLQSALARPRQHHAYSRDADWLKLAGIYIAAIIQNHPFVDGNKRTAFAALFMFLALNGMEFEPPEVDATVTMLRLAAGEMSDDDFTTWVRNNTRSRGA